MQLSIRLRFADPAKAGSAAAFPIYRGSRATLEVRMPPTRGIEVPKIDLAAWVFGLPGPSVVIWYRAFYTEFKPDISKKLGEFLKHGNSTVLPVTG
jgi:hypothetical protein